MNGVIYYSNAGECKRIAEYCAQKLNCPIAEIANAENDYDNAVLVFPVYCQNVPQTVKRFLNTVSAQKLTVIACYGKMNHGNVLYEIQRKYRLNIVGAAYVPTKHAYLDEPRFDDFGKLEPLLEKANDGVPVKIPKSRKNPLANFLPKQRSHAGVKIVKNDNCDNCGLCQRECPLRATINGKTNRRCIRCMRCVTNCPRHALTIKTSAAMKWYLRRKKQEELIIY